jgi:hypothetical protein
LAPGLNLVGLCGDMDCVGVVSCHWWTVTLSCSNLSMSSLYLNRLNAIPHIKTYSKQLIILTEGTFGYCVRTCI